MGEAPDTSDEQAGDDEYEQTTPEHQAHIDHLSRSWFFRIAVTIVILSVGIFAVWLALWPLTIAFLWDAINIRMKSGVGRSVGLSVLLLLAMILYWSRRKIPGFYGIAEVAIGLAIAWTTLGHTNVSRREATLALAASIYIMVRGIDNVVVGVRAVRGTEEKP